MDEHDVDRLLDSAIGGTGGGPPEAFRQRVLRDSMAALGAGRATRIRLRAAGLAAAAVLIVAVSFISGRLSAPRAASPPAVPPTVADGPQRVSVPSELVAWLEAARFFRQLGMEQRVALAYERAGRLLPPDAPLAGNSLVRHGRYVVAAGDVISTGSPVQAEPDSSIRLQRTRNDRQREDFGLPVKTTTAVLAHSFGG